MFTWFCNWFCAVHHFISGSCRNKLGIKEPGKAAHAFRRFRSSILAKSGVEEDIRKFWLGHENNDIRAQYAEQIREDNV